eukprot:1160631-Pelagomonas_calceolata.AAC.5
MQVRMRELVHVYHKHDHVHSGRCKGSPAFEKSSWMQSIKVRKEEPVHGSDAEHMDDAVCADLYSTGLSLAFGTTAHTAALGADSAV